MRVRCLGGGVCALLLTFVFTALGQPARPADTFLRSYFETRDYSLGRPVHPQPTHDGREVLFLRAQPRKAEMSLFAFDVATGKTRELADPAALIHGTAEKLTPAEEARRQRMRVSVGGFTSFHLSEDGRRVLLSLAGRLFLLDLKTHGVRELPVGAGTLDPKFSPDGKAVSFVRDHDVHVIDLGSMKEWAVTHGGTARVSHGVAEFVAQEEMERYTGYWWSPGAQSIAYEEADARKVEVWYVADPSRPGQPPHAVFYPRPGKTNVTARLGIVNVQGGPTVWVQWNRARYPYLVRVNWHAKGGLTVVVETRNQRELVVLRANPQTGATTRLVAETDPDWVNIDQQVPRWLADGRSFLWTSERNGGWQLELRHRDGTFERRLVPPTAGYRGLVSVDDTAGCVYFLASRDPTQVQLWRVSLQGGEPVALTHQPGIHFATFSKNHAVYVHQFSTLEAPRRTTVHSADGTLLAVLPSVAEAPPFAPHVQILKVGKGRDFYARVVWPRDYVAGQRYPVLDHVYGGPHYQMVRRDFAGQLLDQWLADQGFIVVSIDGRGTPNRGRAWERAIYQRFASVPLADQVAGLRALAARFPAMDLHHVGIFGWSFGGYMSALAVLRRPDVFKAGFAGAPVTDWLDYDTHYTERYLGIPPAAAAVYERNSLIPDAPRLRAHLLIVHGTADDNVYFVHTLKLVNALFRAGKDFEVIPLPGFTHMVPDPQISERLEQKRAEFFHRWLGSGPISNGRQP